MLLSAVSVLVVAQSSSEVPEGLMNNPVYVIPKVSYCIFEQVVEMTSFIAQIYLTPGEETSN